MYLSGKKKNSTGRIALTLILAAALFLAACAVPDGGSSAASVNSKSYAVLIGIDRSRISRLKPYRTVVIEPEGFRASDIRKLHRQKKKVYAYINIGSIEKSRSYYSRFSDITLGDYENWPDERWVDVSKKEWQDFVVDELARKYARQGYDGFFLDNADVYYEYHSKAIYSGLRTIVKGLRAYHKKIIINGGSTYVTACMNKKDTAALPDAVNQEEVFTRIDFRHKKFRKQHASDTRYYLRYLKRVRRRHMKVYLVEYGAKGKLAKKISRTCRKYGFVWYNSKNISLK